jgi:hypothetical protein
MPANRKRSHTDSGRCETLLLFVPVRRAYLAGAGPGNTGRLSWPSRSTAATAKK